MLAVLLCVFCASMASLSLGLDVGMISSTLVQPSFIDYFSEPSSSELGGIVSAFSAGACIGAYGCALIADRYGRVIGLLTGAIVGVIGAGLQAGAVNVPMLIVGRLLNGLGAGQLTAVFPVYVSEIAPPTVRGMLGGFQMLMIDAAIFCATGAGYGFSINFTNNWQWRGPLAVQTIPLVILIPLTFVLPEIPRFLVSKGKTDKALRVLRRLHTSDGGEAFVQSEMSEIQTQLEAEKAAFTPSWRQVFTKSSWQKRVILAVVMQCFAQLTGINCVQYYAATIYTQLGFDTQRALLINLLLGAMGFLFSGMWVLLVDRFPRKKLLIFTTLMMGAALLVQSVLSAVYAGKDAANKNALNAQVAMFFVFKLFFNAVGMLAWLIPPEMSPMVIRGKVNSISVSANNIAGLVVAQISPIALNAIGFKFFFVFVASDILAAVCYGFFYPETSKLSLEEIDVLFGDNIVDHHNGAATHSYIPDQQSDVKEELAYVEQV